MKLAELNEQMTILKISLLRFKPKFDEDYKQGIVKIMFPIFKNFSVQEFAQAIKTIIYTKSEYPTPAEILSILYDNRTGITDLRLTLVEIQRKQKTFIQDRIEATKEMSNFDKRKYIQEHKHLKIDANISQVIECLGGDIAEILKYKMKEFREIYGRMKIKQIKQINIKQIRG